MVLSAESGDQMNSDVYFTDMTANSKRNLLDKTVGVARKSAVFDMVEKGDKVAIKLHFGEEGNIAFIPPPLVRVIVEAVKSKGGKPFLTDANTLYSGVRHNAVDHLETALKNGFSYATVGAPVIIADGLSGADYVNVEVNGKHFDQVKISSAIHYADAIISVSHVKGHELFGFGGTLKNLGMGCGCPAGKQAMHSGMVPTVDEEMCTACGVCIKRCPQEAITRKENKKAYIHEERCIGCGECVAFCPVSAIPANWETSEADLQERTAEYAWGVLKEKKGKSGFINFIMNVSPDCDCASWNDVPIVSDLGIMASTDPVAIDQASVDLVTRAPVIENSVLGGKAGAGDDKFRAVHDRDSAHILRHGEYLKMGSRNYVLKKVWMKLGKIVG